MTASAGVEEARLSSAVSELPGIADRYRSFAEEAGEAASSSDLEDLGSVAGIKEDLAPKPGASYERRMQVLRMLRRVRRM